MIELYQYINFSNYPRGFILASTALFSFTWFCYFLFYSIKENLIGLKNLYYPYIIYSFFIFLWILTNTYFQSKAVECFSINNTLHIAKVANVFSYISYACIFNFTCRLLSNRKDHRIHAWQNSILWVFSIYCIYTNIFTEEIITNVKINSAGNFNIIFGPQAFIFFTIVATLTIISFINLIDLFRSKNKIIKLKSIYMIIGMSIFMISTFFFSVVLTYYTNSFSYTWIPPALSIIEVICMGYASIVHRFYSWQYILYLTINFILTSMIFFSPVFIFNITTVMHSHYILLLVWTLCYGLAWRKIWNVIGKYISYLIYGCRRDPISEICRLTSDFKISINQATQKLSEILKIDPKYIFISDAKNYKLYSYYLSEINSALLIEEIEYKASNYLDKNLSTIYEQMSGHNSAMILPLYDNHHSLTRLFITPNKSDGSIYSNEEISALQNLLKKVQSYIYDEYHVKQSQAIAHSITHEMRNPLAQIQLHLENIGQMVKGLSLDTRVFREIEQAKKSIYQGNNIIDAMLQDVHQSSMDSNAIKPYPVSMLIQQAIKDYPFEFDYIAECVVLKIENDFIINVHKILFGFLLFNLLRNAIYYFNESAKNCIEIAVKSDENNNKILFKDYGPRTDQKNQSHIYEDFFIDRNNDETCLGLSYCRRIMQLFNGQIQCKSVYGESTTFILTFPRMSQALKANDPSANQPKTSSNVNLSKLRVLIADDSSSQRLLVKLYLKQLGVCVKEAKNGQDALDLLSGEQFDLILMDIQMPVMDGLTASRKIKKLYRQMPIIALSGESGQEEIFKTAQVMDDRLSKPVSKSQLIEIIYKWSK